jgi:hypothetical protein
MVLASSRSTSSGKYAAMELVGNSGHDRKIQDRNLFSGAAVIGSENPKDGLRRES